MPGSVRKRSVPARRRAGFYTSLADDIDREKQLNVMGSEPDWMGLVKYW